MESKISFVIPAFNCKDTLEESVVSIFDDNFELGDEVIIVNDGSTDSTKDVSENLAQKYSPNIILINNAQNKGCPASRNIGILQSKNNLIFNLDSDNILPPKSVQMLKKELVLQEADVCVFQEYRYFKTDTNKITHKWICVSGQMTLADFLSGPINAGPGGNFLYRKEIWQKIGKYWEYGKGLHEAWGFTLKLLAEGHAKFIIVPDTFYFHRYSHKSLFVRENAKKDEGVEITNKFIKPFLELLSEKSQKYVKLNTRWFDLLDVRPLTLKDTPLGKTGKVIYSSNIKHIEYIIKSIFRKMIHIL